MFSKIILISLAMISIEAVSKNIKCVLQSFSFIADLSIIDFYKQYTYLMNVCFTFVVNFGI